MNIWQMYLLGIAVALFWCFWDFFKYKKIASTKFNEDNYFTKNPIKAAARQTVENFFSNAGMVIVGIATVYTVGYIFALGFIEAIPYF